MKKETKILDNLKRKKSLKKYCALALAVIGTVAAAAGCAGSAAGEDDNTLVIFNYGDYIERETIQMFEEETGIEVKYEEYITPEDMYTKYQSGGINYDLICTSDYMIERMIRDGEAQVIDTSQMEYMDNIDQKYMDFCKAFDPENQYAIPYFFGTVGILYNEKMVDDLRPAVGRAARPGRTRSVRSERRVDVLYVRSGRFGERRVASYVE